MHFDSEFEMSDVRGARADVLKWEPNLCQQCNNARSQPFDRAYIALLEHLDEHEADVGGTGIFRFSDVYGADWELGRANLIKYWVKHIGCRAAVIGLAMPEATIDYLDDASALGDPPHIKMNLLVNAPVFDFRMAHRHNHGSGFDDAHGYTRDGELVAFESFVYWGWLALGYTIDVLDPAGATSFPGDQVRMERVSPE